MSIWRFVHSWRHHTTNFTSLHSVLCRIFEDFARVRHLLGGKRIFGFCANCVCVFIFYILFCICVTPKRYEECRCSMSSWWIHWFYQFGFINWVFIACKLFKFTISKWILIMVTTRNFLSNSKFISYVSSRVVRFRKCYSLMSYVILTVSTWLRINLVLS